MDIVKKKPEAGPLKRKLPIVIVAFSILVLSGWTIAHSGSTPRISRSAILLGKVKNGDLDVLIEGYGNLRSEKQKLLMSNMRELILLGRQLRETVAQLETMNGVTTHRRAISPT